MYTVFTSNRSQEPLSAAAILRALNARSRALVNELHVFPELDSTNAHLLRAAVRGIASGSVCLAERQIEGRGRRGRSWISPFGTNLYLSILWRFPFRPRDLIALGPTAGLAVARELESLGLASIGLKWPNDLICQGRKLGGLLLERADASEGCCVVIGVGINTAMPNGEAIDQPWTDLESVLPGKPPARNRLAAGIIGALLTALQHYAHRDVGDLPALWQRFDILGGRAVDVRTPAGEVHGRAAGVDGQGRLLLNVDGVLQRYTSGEVSVRLST